MKIRRSHLYAFAFLLASLAAMPEGARSADGSVAYTYDALGRVLSVTYDNGITITYSYDPNGNRLTQTVRVTCLPTLWGCVFWGDVTWGYTP